MNALADMPNSVLAMERLMVQTRNSEAAMRTALGPPAYITKIVEDLKSFERMQAKMIADVRSSDALYRRFMDDAATNATAVAALRSMTMPSMGNIAAMDAALRSATEILRFDMQAAWRTSAMQESLDRALAGHAMSEASRAALSSQRAFAQQAARAYEVLGTARTASSPYVDLLRMTVIEPYCSARSLGVISGVPDDIIASETDAGAEDSLAALGDELEPRLAAVNPKFVEPYRGALYALRVRNPDWHRHVAISLRELFDRLLDMLAPASLLMTHFSNPSTMRNADGFTRRAQLLYVFREVAVDQYERMAEKDIDLALATFYPANAGVHSMPQSLTDLQIQVFTRRIQGCLSVVLQAADF